MSHHRGIMPSEENSTSKLTTSSSTSPVEVDLPKLKSRYDALLPKYGFLWRSMANKQMKQNPNDNKARVDQSARQTIGKENHPPGTIEDVNRWKNAPSFIDAIESKQPISLNIHENCGEECDCSDPIIEIDENDSVYDDETLVDSEDEGEQHVKDGASKLLSEKSRSEAIEKIEFSIDEIIELGDDSDDEEEEVVVTGRKKKRTKTFVIESDDESSQSAEEISLDGESERSNTHADENDDIARSNPPMDEIRATPPYKSTSANHNQTLSDDGSSASEKEWIELSSDEEEEVETPRINTVVILSSDEEEESESDDEDAHSVFSIGSSDSDETTSDAGTSDRRPSPDSRGNRALTSDKKINTIKNTPRQNSTNNTSNKSQLSSKSSSLAFRKKRDDILASTFSSFNQLAFQNALSPVEVTWSNKLNTTAGITRMKGKLGRPDSRVATIELATKVIDNEERLRSTLLHEMCHAAAWLVDGVHKPPHGKCFKKWAAISMKKIRDVEVTTTHDYQIAYKYAWACTSKTCTVVIKRHSRSVDPNKHCCGRCKSKLIEIEVPGSDKDISKAGYTPKQRKTSQYALFVKEQTPHVRSSLAKARACRPNEVSQADVMKECGRLWRSEKNKRSRGSQEGDGLEIMAKKLSGMSLNAAIDLN